MTGHWPRPQAEQLQHAVKTVRAALADSQAVVQALRAYYDPVGRYAGALFLDLPNDPRNLTATDLYALSTLDVRATPLAGRRLLYPGEHREAVLAALVCAELPADADLRSADDGMWDAAVTLYEAAKAAMGGNPWVTASKLCARKRPSFFPIRDSVVTERRFRLGKSYWIDWNVYRHLMLDPEIETQLDRVTHQAADLLDEPILDPPLRRLDVVLWATAPKELRQRRR